VKENVQCVPPQIDGTYNKLDACATNEANLFSFHVHFHRAQPFSAYMRSADN